MRAALEKKPDDASLQDPALAGERICHGCTGILKCAVRDGASMVNPNH